VVNPPAYPDPARLGSLSWRQFLDNRRYLAEGGQMGLETKRGCEGGCIYCADPVAKGRTVRLRPWEQVAAEMENLLARRASTAFTCATRSSTCWRSMPARSAVGWCGKDSAGACAGTLTRPPDPSSPELARLMCAAGCAGINFGVDSPHPAVLRTLGRSFGPREVAGAVEACRRAGMACMVDLLVGGPGETPETVAATVGLVK
ncbi:MAG: radical SAM protein, partial [Firmicutes bacterium]|nr:radical SAM protein [Bacillota bacterium]